MVLVECWRAKASSASAWAKVLSWISRSAPRASSTAASQNTVSVQYTTLAPGRSGPQRLAPLMIRPSSRVMLRPCLSSAYTGPGGMPRARARSTSNRPGRGFWSTR